MVVPNFAEKGQSMDKINLKVPPAEREALVAELRERGIRFLAPSDAEPGPERLSDTQLLTALAQHPDPRLRLALIPWLLLHPEVHTAILDVIHQLPPAGRTELQALYMAAVYLQRLWRTRLSLYLGYFEELPDLFSRELGLPSPEERYGKVGLHALAEWHANQFDYPVNRLASYKKIVYLLFEQLEREAHDYAVYQETY